ncbi:hypothetical protein BJ165DRAFT_1597079 [Panaeolus papilionaceus]|nr:hypothetical protein BJ165DRAFT_1597079 [Panaeolus papilionaceus]
MLSDSRGTQLPVDFLPYHIMSTARAKRYYYLSINGPLSVETIAPGERLEENHLLAFVLIGPTGAGKSSFVESIVPDQNLLISKDTLESVTQNVVCYRIKNLSYGKDFSYVLLDTPGFLDPELSESRIIRMITDALDNLRKSAAIVVVIILYFQPITDIRISRSKEDSVNLLRAFSESFKASNIDVITSMWNTLATTAQIEDANIRFESLRDRIFNNSEKLNIKVSKFDRTTHAALEIMDRTWSGWIHDIRTVEHWHDPQCHSLVRDNLIKRVAETQEQLRLLAEDKQHATTPGNEDLRLLEVLLQHRSDKLCLSVSSGGWFRPIS